MMMFFVPPVTLVALIAWFKTGRWFAGAPLLAIGLGYALALAGFCANPYFEDNGSLEFIEWRFRFVMALELSGWFALPILIAINVLRGGYYRLAAWRDARRPIRGGPGPG